MLRRHGKSSIVVARPPSPPLSQHHLLLIDHFQAMALVLIQGRQDADTIVQVRHQLLYLAVLDSSGRQSRRGMMRLQWANAIRWK